MADIDKKIQDQAIVENEADIGTAADVDEIMKKYDRESNVRIWEGVPKQIVRLVLAAFMVFMVYMNLWATWSGQIRRCLFVGMVVLFTFFVYPAKKGDVKPNHMPWYDILLAIVGCIPFFYYVANFNRIVSMGIAIGQTEVILGIIGILVLAECCRRAVGVPILCVAGVFILYAFVGRHMSLQLVVYNIFYTTNGIIGTPISVCSTYIALFLLFGAFLEASGCSDFINDIAISLTGKIKSGPALSAVVASGLMGSINGSAVANVVTTGTFTIPLMKKTGYSKEFAGSVEATASVGGQLLPPIMGAAAFVMAETLGVKYGVIIRAAVIPALLYYMGILVQVQMRATKENLNGLPKEQMPKPSQVMKERGHLLIPIAFLLYMLIWSGRTVIFSAFWTIIVTILVAETRPISRMSLKDICDAFVAGAKSTVPVAIACACVGIIVGVCGLTGFALNVAHAIIRIGQSSVLLTLVFTMITCMILGMGLASGPAYIVTAIAVGPALADMGFPLMTAHFIMMWFSIDSEITPPVGLASIVGAGIANADPMKTMFTAFKYAKALYILPILFYYRPALLLQSSLFDIALTFVTVMFGLIAFAAVWENYLMRRTTLLERILLLGGALLLFIPGHIWDFAGIGLFIIVYCLQRYYCPAGFRQTA